MSFLIYPKPYFGKVILQKTKELHNNEDAIVYFVKKYCFKLSFLSRLTIADFVIVILKKYNHGQSVLISRETIKRPEIYVKVTDGIWTRGL